MNRKNIKEALPIGMVKDEEVRRGIQSTLLTGSEWAKRDALRAFNKAFGDLDETIRRNMYGTFVKRMFATTTPPQEDMIVALKMFSYLTKG